MIKMTKYEYEILTNSWTGPPGAGYNAAYEFCQEFGWIDHNGDVTDKGREALKEYENSA